MLICFLAQYYSTWREHAVSVTAPSDWYGLEVLQKQHELALEKMWREIVLHYATEPGTGHLSQRERRESMDVALGRKREQGRDFKEISTKQKTQMFRREKMSPRQLKQPSTDVTHQAPIRRTISPSKWLHSFSCGLLNFCTNWSVPEGVGKYQGNKDSLAHYISHSWSSSER